MELKSESSFTQRQLPWIVAGAALVLYLLTSTTNLSFLGLGASIRVAGWSWQPVFSAPLLYVLTYPIHWLPAAWQVGALNAFAAICAALTLALLARSVALLPHNRTRDQRQAERSEDGLLSIGAAWVPALLAVLACGLQRTFWEHAVIGTGEALDLLVFAYVIRCLLEFRIDQRDAWLYRMSFVYGLGITNNYALIAFFPALLVAVFWIKGVRGFFNMGFCTRMALLGLGGLMLYFLLPITQLSYPHTDLDFWQTLRINLGQQKGMLLRFPRFLLLFTALTSLLPVLFMGIKWPASFGDISTVGNALTNIMTHVLHAVFLLACLYVTFDPAFSPRKLAGVYGYPFLTTYYLGALSIGYFAGYFLLVFGAEPLKAWQRPSALRSALNKAIVVAIWIGLVGVPVGLVIKNWPHMQGLTSKYLSQFGATAAKELKETTPQGAIVLSDDPFRLYATYQGLINQGGGSQYVLVDTSALSAPAYHRYLHQKYPKSWPQVGTNLPPTAMVDSMTLIGLMSYLSQSNAVFYLHPTFGYYLEKFYLQPRNLLYGLKAYPSNAVDSPLLTEAEARQNVEFWKQFRAQHLNSLVREIKSFEKKKELDESLLQAGMLYSRALNYLGVELQKAGRLEPAGECFGAATELYPQNIPAMRNQEVNKALRAGSKAIPAVSDAVEKKFVSGYGGNLEPLLFGGPIDDTVFSYRIAEMLARGRNSRQAAQYLRRVLTFEPQNDSARLGLISLYNQIHQPDLALQAIAAFRDQPRTNALAISLEMDLVQSEANAYLGKDDLNTALKVLQKARQNYPTNIEPFLLLNEFYLQRADLTNALKNLETEMKVLPEDPRPLIDYARVKILNDQVAEAIPYLNNAIKLDGRNVNALFNRAVAHLRLKNFDQAENDYKELESILPKLTVTVAYGLHEVAFQKKNRKQALKYGKDFLKLAPPNAPEFKKVDERIQQMKKGLF